MVAPCELRILGPTELTGSRLPPSEVNALPPKRLALLAYLALATADGFRRRDQVVGLLWPDLPQEAARTQLRKALSALRDSLGQDALATRGESELRLDPDHVWCDAVALRQHIKAGRWADAVALYRGELLDGLYPEGVAQGFEEWLADSRKSLREQAAMAAWECSRMEEELGDRKAAAVLARRALELSPDDEEGVRRLMSLLDRHGDRAGALRVYTDWQARLQQEYGVEPAPETRKLARKVQAARKGESHETPPLQEPLALAPEPIVHATRVEPPRRRPMGPVLLTIAAVLGIPVIAGGVALLRSVRAEGAAPRPSITVMALRIIGNSTASSSAETIVEELITALIQDSGIVVLTAPGVASTGKTGAPIEADYVVDGAVQVEAGSLRMTLRLVRTDDNTAIWAGTYDVQPAVATLSPRQAAAQAAAEIRTHLATATTAYTSR